MRRGALCVLAARTTPRGRETQGHPNMPGRALERRHVRHGRARRGAAGRQPHEPRPANATRTRRHLRMVVTAASARRACASLIGVFDMSVSYRVGPGEAHRLQRDGTLTWRGGCRTRRRGNRHAAKCSRRPMRAHTPRPEGPTVHEATPPTWRLPQKTRRAFVAARRRSGVRSRVLAPRKLECARARLHASTPRIRLRVLVCMRTRPGVLVRVIGRRMNRLTRAVGVPVSSSFLCSRWLAPLTLPPSLPPHIHVAHSVVLSNAPGHHPPLPVRRLLGRSRLARICPERAARFSPCSRHSVCEATSRQQANRGPSVAPGPLAMRTGASQEIAPHGAREFSALRCT